MRSAIDAEQTDRRSDRRLRLTGRRLLKTCKRLERPRRPDLAKRHRRIVLQRSIELRDGRNGVDSVRGLVVAERFDHGAPKEILASGDLTQQRLTGAGALLVGGRRERRHRTHERGPDELALFLVQRCQKLREQAPIRVVLEKTVGDGAQAIVGTRQSFAHRVPGSRIVERREQDEGAISHVAIGVLADGLKQGGNRLRRRRPSDDARRIGANGIVELSEIVDRGPELRRRNRLR